MTLAGSRYTHLRLPKPLAENYEWQERGNCVGMDTEIFFLPTNARNDEKRTLVEAAKTICRNCPVISECLTHALEVGEEYGVWGGLSEEERRYLLARRKR